ncbi:hypothetical protein NGTWS0302_24180 [Mycolicibacterium cyprinidarum]|uniref:Uncharacterized protein n=1 Tax=Mycolicibacterium cyprinidarum TaxID=2860311 RepID=A0ABQ4VEE5_9MYCO|nr:hypothetical protein NGTWS0302_24180 [Mycolicibacterium sp. NGTWS0302]GJF13461.1 hypothetical protein NGTWS1803_24880 [Mycolicibacterium sp. NGTWS1803]GJF17124.1 hypothetical protein NGTWS1702_23070 [Mycolicibacterium sp. NGTWSNA01]
MFLQCLQVKVSNCAWLAARSWRPPQLPHFTLVELIRRILRRPSISALGAATAIPATTNS